MSIGQYFTIRVDPLPGHVHVYFWDLSAYVVVFCCFSSPSRQNTEMRSTCLKPNLSGLFENQLLVTWHSSQTGVKFSVVLFSPPQTCVSPVYMCFSPSCLQWLCITEWNQIFSPIVLAPTARWGRVRMLFCLCGLFILIQMFLPHFAGEAEDKTLCMEIHSLNAEDLI